MYETKDQIMDLVNDDVVKSHVVGYNTVEYYTRDGARVIRLHQTDILRFKNDCITLNTDGWRTLTTKNRMNEFLPPPWRVWQKKDVWYVGTSETNKEVYKDGTRVFDFGIISVPQ